MGSTDAHSGQKRSAPPSRATAPPRDERPAVTHAPHTASQRTPIDFAAEYQKAYRVLWVVAAGVLGRASGAEDVLQEAALLALKKVDQFEPGTHFAAWMAQMVRFVALNQTRKNGRLRNAIALEREVDAGTIPYRPVMRDADLRLGTRGELPPDQRSFDDDLMHALENLTEIARACLLLRTLEGLNYEEIGKLLAIPEGTAMSHVHRSRMRLREELSQRRATSSPKREERQQ